VSDFGWWAEQAKEEAMRVRCIGINTPVEWTVVEESSRYYIAKSDSTLGLACLDKAYYEPVQEWVDVTHECTLEASAHGAYSLYRLGYLVHPDNTAHRVTCKGSTFKVEVKR